MCKEKASTMMGMKERIKRDTERDFFMSAPEAVEYGIVDEVLTLAEK